MKYDNVTECTFISGRLFKILSMHVANVVPNLQMRQSYCLFHRFLQFHDLGTTQLYHVMFCFVCVVSFFLQESNIFNTHMYFLHVAGQFLMLKTKSIYLCFN